MTCSESLQYSPKTHNLVSWIVAFLFFLSLYPYFVWSIEPFAVLWLSIPLILFFFSQLGKSLYSFYFMFFLFISIWAGFWGGGNLFGITMVALSSLIFAVREKFLIQVYSRYRLIYILFITVSLIVFLLVTFGISLPYYSVPPPPRNTMEFDFYIYPFYACPSYDGWQELGINRFNALFDEPGVVGTISFILLFIEKFNLKKIGNCILLASGILSFSLFFYVASFIYFVYYLFFERTKLISKVLIGTIILVGLFVFAQTELFQGYIGDRLLWDAEAQTISGDDRSSDDLKEYVEQINGTTAYFFGKPEMVAKFQDSASLEKQILAYGFITIFLYFVFFILYSYKHLKFSKEWLLFLAVFFAAMYNRPTMFEYARLFLYCMMIFVWSCGFQVIFEKQDVGVNSKSWLLRNF